MQVLVPGLLEEITRRLVAEFQPEQIFLFGSHAWGRPTADSDLDLLVVLADLEPPWTLSRGRPWQPSTPVIAIRATWTCSGRLAASWGTTWSFELTS